VASNLFIRYGQDNRIVMSGGPTIVKVPEGAYTAEDLCKLWRDSNSLASYMINSGHIRVIQNVSASLDVSRSSQSYNYKNNFVNKRKH
jgi:hypothetical protein